MSIFNFEDYDDERETAVPYDDYLTVRAFLDTHYGDVGVRIYDDLLRMAKRTTDDVGGTPGLIFTPEGGEFVSFSDEPDAGLSFFSEED